MTVEPKHRGKGNKGLIADEGYLLVLDTTRLKNNEIHSFSETGSGTSEAT